MQAFPSQDQVEPPPTMAARRIARIEANAALNFQERSEQKLILESRPQVVFVELSRRCNLACSMCHRWLLPKESFTDMRDELIERLMDEFLPTAKIVDFHGLGESTLHPGFSEIVKRTSELGPRVRLVTNMNGLSDLVIETLVDIDAYVCFSLGALEQKQYVRIYSKGDFGNLSQNLQKFAILRERSCHCQDMSCMSMIYYPNLGQIKEVMRFVHDHGVRHHRIFPMYLKEGDRRFVGNYMDEWTRTVEKVFDLADQLGMEVRVLDWPLTPPDSTKTLVNFTCHRPWTHLHVNVDGKIGLCDYNEHVDSMSELFVGRQTFQGIWNSEIYQQIRRDFRDEVPSRSNPFCGDVCRHTKYVDFDDFVLPELKDRVLSNHNRGI